MSKLYLYFLFEIGTSFCYFAKCKLCNGAVLSVGLEGAITPLPIDLPAKMQNKRSTTLLAFLGCLLHWNRLKKRI